MVGFLFGSLAITSRPKISFDGTGVGFFFLAKFSALISPCVRTHMRARVVCACVCMIEWNEAFPSSPFQILPPSPSHCPHLKCPVARAEPGQQEQYVLSLALPGGGSVTTGRSSVDSVPVSSTENGASGLGIGHRLPYHTALKADILPQGGRSSLGWEEAAPNTNRPASLFPLGQHTSCLTGSYNHVPKFLLPTLPILVPPATVRAGVITPLDRRGSLPPEIISSFSDVTWLIGGRALGF